MTASVLLLYRDDCEWREVAGAWPDTPQGLKDAKAACENPPDPDADWYDWSVHRIPFGQQLGGDDRETQVWPEPEPEPEPTELDFKRQPRLMPIAASVGGPAIRNAKR